MPTILELKTEYNELDTQLKTMVGGKNIFDDAWSPNELVVDGVTDETEKMTAYTAKAQQRKAIEHQLTQAESIRKSAAANEKGAPLDSEFTFTDPNKAAVGGIKSAEGFKSAIGQMANAFKEGTKTYDLNIAPEFLKAVVVAAGSQARLSGQQVMVPAFPTTDVLDIAEWFGIESNIYTRYEMVRGSSTGTRLESAAIVDLNPTVPQRSFILRSIAGYVSTARESLEDLGQLEMAVRELIDREMRKTMGSQAFVGDNADAEWYGLDSQITKTTVVASDSKILDRLRPLIIAAVANGYPFTHFFCDATTAGLFVESLDKRNFSQYDRERYPFGYYLGCIPVATAQKTAATALLGVQSNIMVVHKGNIEVMQSDDVHFLTNAIVLRGTIRGNIVYRYPATEGQQLTTTNNFIVQS